MKYIIVLVYGFLSAFAFGADFKLNQENAPSKWLEVDDIYARASTYHYTTFEYGGSLAIQEFLEKNKDWELIGVANYVYNYDTAIELPYITRWKEILIQQLPEKHIDLPVGGMHFIIHKKSKVKIILQVGDKGSVVRILSNPKDKKAVAVADKLEEEFTKLMKIGGVYIGGVIELKATGQFGFLDQAAKNNYSWDHFIFDAEETSKIRRKIEGFITKYDYKTWSENNLPLNRGVLLHGPPGTGKSFIGKILVSHVLRDSKYPKDLTYIQVQARHISSRDSVKKVFDLARAVSPTIVFMEDIDLIAGTHRNHKAEIKNELMQQLSGVERLNGVITIGTTNVASIIDPALKRSKRLTYAFEIGYPKALERKRLIKLYTENHIKLTETELRELADLSDDMSGADIKEWVQFAMEARLLSSKDKTKLELSFEDLTKAIELKKTTTITELSEGL